MIHLQRGAHVAFPWQDLGGLHHRGPPGGDATWAALRIVDPSDPAALAAWCARLVTVTPPFVAVCAGAHGVVTAVDRARSFPLFWGRRDADVFVGEDAGWVHDHVDPAGGPASIDRTAAAEARLTGFVSGPDTLHPDVKQIRGGEVLQWIEGGEGIAMRRANLALPTMSGASGDAAEATACLRAVIARLIDSLQGRPVVLPLTGGYDSRCLAMLLKELRYERVLCLGTHRAGHWEAVTGCEVATRLGYPWVHVGSEPEQWKAWYASDDRRRYSREAAALAAMPPLPGWPQLRELRVSGRAEESAIVVSGHFGDFVTGSATPEIRGPSRRDALERGMASLLARRRYALNPWPRDPALVTAVRGRLHASIEAAAADATGFDDAVDRWEWQEYQTKRAAAGTLACAWHGFEWRVPFADPELVTFFRGLSREDRAGSALFHRVVQALGRRWALPPANPGVERARRARRWARRAGLLGPARVARRLARRYDGRGIERGDGPGWSGIFDPERIRRTYTGREGVESYLIRDWLEDLGAGDLV